jgi:hypothetical protein
VRSTCSSSSSAPWSRWPSSSTSRPAALLALLAATAALAACGGQLASSGDEREVRIAYVPKSLNQEYWVNTRKGAEAAVRGKRAQIVTQSANADTEIAEQIDIVENLLAQKVDALAIAPSSSDLLKPVLERAAEDIPVVLVDADIAGWKPKTAYVGTENFEAAKLAGRHIARELRDGGKLAIIAGIPGSEIGIERVDGLKAGLKAAKSRVEVVKEVPGNFDREQAVGAMEDILQTTPTSTPCSPPTTSWRSARSSRSRPAARTTRSCSSASTARSRRPSRSSPGAWTRPSPRTPTTWARSASSSRCGGWRASGCRARSTPARG